MQSILGKKVLSILVLFAIGLIFDAEKTESSNRYFIHCEDEDVFMIYEGSVLETSNLPDVKDDLIIVEVERRRLTFYRKGEIFKRYTVAVGKPSTPSPVGEWRVIHKGGNWGGGFGSRWIGINVPWGIYGIHGTNKPDSIGAMSSHGCIRMHNRNIVELYNIVKLGTPVHILGDLPKVRFRTEYKRRSTGKDVLRLQFALRAAGFDQGPADARFGPEMEKAVIKLEKYYGLKSDGVLSLDEQYLLGVR